MPNIQLMRPLTLTFEMLRDRIRAVETKLRRKRSEIMRGPRLKILGVAAWAVAAWGVAAWVVAAGCKVEAPPSKPLAEGEPAKRAAMSFVHCVEGGNTSCIRSGLSHGGWDAFFLLGWLGSGSPTSILEVLPRQLVRHASPKEVQLRFVHNVERYATLLRGAECNPATVQPLGPLVDQTSQVASQRLQSLGLTGTDMRQVVEGLTAEAKEGLKGGFLVQMTCQGDPYRLYLGTNTEGQRHQVVGMMSVLPRFLGGNAEDRANVPARLKSRSLGLAGTVVPIETGTVHPWLPIRLEEF